MATAAHATVRRWILTGSIAAITATGAILGATLKGDQEVNQKRKEILQASPEERIAQLELAREELVMRRNEMQRKIVGFREKRVRESEEKERRERQGR